MSHSKPAFTAGPGAALASSRPGQWFRRFLSMALAVMCLTSTAWAQNSVTDFTDLNKSHWAYLAISDMVDKYHILSGFPNKTFQGSKNVDRYEMAAAMTKVLAAIESAKSVDLKNPVGGVPRAFTDVPATHWAAVAVNGIANDYGLVEGFPDKTFQGQRDTTRFETAALLYRLCQRLEERIGPYQGQTGNDFEKFKDITPTHWAAPAVKAVVDRYAILQGFPDHTFKGGRNLTRYEFAALLYRLMQFAMGLEKPVVATPTPAPTPTPVPTPEPIKVIPLPQLQMLDFQLNGFGGASSSFGSPYYKMLGGFGQVTGWLPYDFAKRGPGHFGLSAYTSVTYGRATTYVLSGVVTPPPTVAAGAGLAPIAYFQTNIQAGVQVKYRLDMSLAMGTTPDESDRNPSLIFGLGYAFIRLDNPLVPYQGNGVVGSLEGEYPLAYSVSGFTMGFYGGVSYAYYFPNSQNNYNYLNARLPQALAYGAGVEFGGFNWLESGDISFRLGFQGYTIFQDTLGDGGRMFQLNGGNVGVRLRI